VSHRDPTTRFEKLVDTYIQYRPSYPVELFELLETECGLDPDWAIADVGSGTGILSRLLLQRGHRVFGIEPNEQMRRAAEGLLTGFSGFQSVAATAEDTTLGDHSVDFVVAAQSFHWFDPKLARREFARILRPGGIVALIWNDRRKDTTQFLSDYERLLLDFGTDYERVDHTRIGHSALKSFFGSEGFRSAAFDNQQRFDFYGLRGRLLSASYVPSENDPGFIPMIRQLHAIFARHQHNGEVSLDYDTRIYYGHLS
jgi:SAM-dependent methyltransferase